MTPNLAYAVELLEQAFQAMPRSEETVMTLCCVIKARGEFADCTSEQREKAYARLFRLYEGGYQLAEDALNRLINLH